MGFAEPTSARLLLRSDRDAALAFAGALGVHGVYVGNHVAVEERALQGQLLGFFDGDVLTGLAYFGDRGNLIIVERVPLSPDRVANAVDASPLTWRIALAPEAIVDEFALRERGEALVHRRQLYYGMDGVVGLPEAPPWPVRRAQRRDQSRLLEAALDLNRVDLEVQPSRVHRPWLRDAIRRRIRHGDTWVVGPPGELLCKVDVGSRGPFGAVLEGVYTFPEARQRGLACRLVAGVAAEESAQLTCLHVAENNTAARRAYERAGMRELGRLGILLRR